MLADALSHWRGSPYAEFTECEPLESTARRLEELRLDAVEGRISADLRRPGVAPPVAELEALVRWHPMRESFWGLLMCAHYRGGSAGGGAGDVPSCPRGAGRGGRGGPRSGTAGAGAAHPARRIPHWRSTGWQRHCFPHAAIGSYGESVALVGRADLLDELAGLRDEALSGAGRLVLVHGEAGVGQVRPGAGVLPLSGAASVPVLQGACDPLSSPRPLGPLVDVAATLGPRVGELLRSGEREGLFVAVLEALRELAPAVFVIEDLHWADSSTLDLVRFLARRVGEAPLAIMVTYRDDQLPANDPVRVTVGDVAPMPDVRRVQVPPLSAEAVAELARESGIDPAALHAETGGNPFFVTEVIASGGAQLPQTVQDAVLARAQRLSSAGATGAELGGGRRVADRADAAARPARCHGRGDRRVRRRGHAPLRPSDLRLPARAGPAGRAGRHPAGPPRRAALAGAGALAHPADLPAAVRPACRACRDGRRR